jgi:formylglycine-generating enzyme required for sulfatase activity
MVAKKPLTNQGLHSFSVYAKGQVMSSKSPLCKMLLRSTWFRLIACFFAASGCRSDDAIETVAANERVLFEVLDPVGSTRVRHVPASSFLMGSDRGEEDERPEREVDLSGFFVHETEVTVEDYADCVTDGTCREPAIGGECNWEYTGREGHPVNCASWYDAVRFCDWAGGRLPTEAEWEKAARGESGALYPWGNDRVDCSRAVVGYGLGCGEQSTWPVASFPEGRSDYGVYDMVGNVYEWTLDTYDSQAYSRLGIDDPVHLDGSGRKVLRGNSWYYSDPGLDSRLSNRYVFPPSRFYPYIGFRCVFAGSDDRIHFVASDALQSEPAVGLDRTWLERNDQARQREGFFADPVGQVLADMIQIPAGSFAMGSEIGQFHELPVRDVFVDAFEMDRYEVSVADYAECVSAGNCSEPYSGGPIFPKPWEWENCNWGIADRANHPVNCVNWFEANTYCNWANKRLPTEAEWEKAARGDDGRRYPWGDEQPDCDRAVIDSGGDGCGRETTWPVGSRPAGASPYGVEDMSGNVWEWVDDWYAYDYYTRAPDVNPRNTDKRSVNAQPGWAEGKVLRGGSWADQATSLHSASHRLGYPEDTAPDYTIGFRCARDLSP